MSFSNDTGGTALAMPSPTHARYHMDMSTSTRSLRRTLSRSPSKLLARTKAHHVENSLQNSPQSPFRRAGSVPPQSLSPRPYTRTSTPVATSTEAYGHSRLCASTTPVRKSSKLSLRSAKAAKTYSSFVRPHASPKSPLKRAIDSIPDTSNPFGSFTPAGSPKLTTESSSYTPRSPLPVSRKGSEKSSRHSLHLDVSGSAGSPQYEFFKELGSTTQSPVQTPSGALKRSDATMNLDQPAQGSPVAKRRSMHGTSGLGSFKIAASPPKATFQIHSDTSQEQEESEYKENQVSQTLSILTNTELSRPALKEMQQTFMEQQRDPSLLRRVQGERDLSIFNPVPGTPSSPRPRLSENHFVPPQSSKDSPFFFGATNSPIVGQTPGNKSQPPHPLSKAMAASSSEDNRPHETKTTMGAPPRALGRVKQNPFSQSLPMNATRPLEHPLHDHNRNVVTPSHPGQLWAGAFNSTGLISKVNRNLEEENQNKLAPPDTPCKRPSNVYATFPPPAGSTIRKKPANFRNSFNGASGTPFKPTSAEAPSTFGKPRKGLNIFQRGSGVKASKRGGLVIFDDDKDVDAFAQAINSEAPPTPTRSLLPNSLSDVSEQSQESPSAGRTIPAPLSAVRPGLVRQSSLSPIARRKSPHTPQENMLPADTSRLSISLGPDDSTDNGGNLMPPPATPTTARGLRSSTSVFVTPQNVRNGSLDIDASLYGKFENIEQIGKGEFSIVYRATQTDMSPTTHKGTSFHSDFAGGSPGAQVYAIKKSKQPYLGYRDRELKLREVKALQALREAEHTVHYVHHWEHQGHLYIQTDFCEEGTLDKFLANVGQKGRLDDFRIFKILQDICLGLKEIHDVGFMHLDIKPANIFITFEGIIKIGDFGLAQTYPAEQGIDVEGDREYMAPELLSGQASKASDVFSLGLMTLEAAANVVLPDNGPSWVALRSGDLSEVPSLTWNPSSNMHGDSFDHASFSSRSRGFQRGSSHDASNLFGSSKRSELTEPPTFMTNSSHPSSLDNIVKWMTAKEPQDRPIVDQVLDSDGLLWVSERRNAPATVFEGNWGPAEMFPVSIVTDFDTEMTDA